MNWKWPWVSRRALEILEQQISELKAERIALQEKYDSLDNQFTWRATGVAKDPAKLPEQYRSRFKVAEPQVIDPLADQVPKPIAALPNLRDRIKAKEEQNEREFLEAQKRVTPISGPKDLSAAQ